MTEYMIVILGDADRWWTTMTPGDGIELRRTVTQQERAS